MAEFIVTEHLAQGLERTGLTGFRLAAVETSAAGKEDFGRTGDGPAK